VEYGKIGSGQTEPAIHSFVRFNSGSKAHKTRELDSDMHRQTDRENTRENCRQDTAKVTVNSLYKIVYGVSIAAQMFDLE